MWLLDTNVLRAFLDRNDPTHQRVLAHGDLVDWGNVRIPVVVATDVLVGRLRYIEEAHRRSSTRLLDGYLRFQETFQALTLMSIVPMSREAVQIYRSGAFPGRMSRNDRLIAAIAISGGHTLVTRNVGDSRNVPELRIENWIDDPLS